ncbi:MAG: nucleotidyltransferase family protein [Candidatus Omnitrophica bacterium]|nr:nucleotidyltransferase family protein [Candidatus Omnitrophota bacterium]
MFDNIEFSAEDKLILLSSNINNLNAPCCSGISNIQNINWDYIINKQDYRSFAPALYLLLKNLKEIEKEIIPVSYYNNLKNSHYHTAISNLKLYEQLLEICSIVKGSGVEIIFLKGTDFLQTIYEDHLGLRWVDDIDILVRKQDSRNSQAFFRNAGYKEIKYALTPFCHNLALHKEHGGKLIEIHCHLLHSAAEQRKINLNIEELFKDSQSINYLENTISILSAEDSLLYRCLDLVNRHSSSLHCALDISAIIYHYKNIDWEKITRKAFSWKAQFFIYRGLKFAKERAGVSIPEVIIKELGGLSSFFYNLFPADQQIFNHYYSIGIFIKDYIRTAKKYKNKSLKYAFSDLFPVLTKKNIFLKVSFIFIYTAAVMLHLLRFIARGMCNSAKATKFTHTIAYFLTVRYKNLKTGLNKLCV